MATVKLENIYKSFGETEVLFDINLEIRTKSLLSLWDPQAVEKPHY